MKKRLVSVFKFTILTLLFLFITLYISDINGYFAYSNYQKRVLTEESIQQFEEDVRNGNMIDVNDYVLKTKDYSNNISRVSLDLSNKIGGMIRSGIVYFFDKITSNIE